MFNRAEYLPTGDPLTQAFESEHHASQGGQIIVSKQVYELVHDTFLFEIIPEHDPTHASANGPFHFVKGVVQEKKVRLIADALLLKHQLNPSQIERIKSSIKSYVPAALQPFIEIDEEKWSSELRRLSIMFVNLGIDLSDSRTDKGIQRIQQVIQTVQKCVYMHEGSLNKLIMDDKGSTLIVVFGMPPMAHQDDAVRAVLTAFSLTSELKKIDCRCAIGIATGLVFAGVVGTSGSRRE